MNAWFELLSRELLLLAVLAALGIGPVALLHPSVDRATRLALAPAFGLAVAVCALVTTLWRIPAYKGWPILVVLMAASIALAVWRSRRAAPDAPERAPLRIGRREAAQLLVLTGVVLVALSLPLAQRGSAGPVGGYRIADATGYVAEIDGAQRMSLHTASLLQPPWRDLTLQYWSGMSRNFQQVGFDAVAAHVNELAGLHATDTYSPFLIALILVGALGAWATVRQVTGTRSWAAVLAGGLFAGPFFRTLFMDGSQGAISGLAVLLPVLLAGWWALRHRRPWDILAFGLLAAGLQTLYPLFVPPVVAGAALVLLIVGGAALARRRLGLGLAARVAGCVAAAVVVAAAITPVAFERNVRYWKSIFQGQFSFAGLPQYDLPTAIVPSWLLQTRELYFLPHLDGQSLGQLLVSLVIPAAMLAVIVAGLVRYRVAAGALAVVAAAAFLAFTTATSNDCSYCEQRNLLVVAPIAMTLVGIGLAGLRVRRGALAVAAVPLAAVFAVAVASMAHHTMLRLTDNSYIYDEQINDVLAHLPRDGRPVQVEGFGAGGLAPMEEPLAYHRVNEVSDAPLSLAMETDESHGLLYLGGQRPIGLEFRPDYRYVLTRLPGVRDPSRRTLARSGPIALQERVADLDVTVTGGPFTAFSWQDMKADAWMLPDAAIHFWVIGGPQGREAWLSVQAEATVPVRVRANGVTFRQVGRTLTACMRVGTDAPVRRADMYFSYAGVPPAPPVNEYAYPNPVRGVRLVKMQASLDSCRPATRT